jgi:hypothetical protein
MMQRERAELAFYLRNEKYSHAVSDPKNIELRTRLQRRIDEQLRFLNQSGIMDILKDAASILDQEGRHSPRVLLMVPDVRSLADPNTPPVTAELLWNGRCANPGASDEELRFVSDAVICTAETNIFEEVTGLKISGQEEIIITEPTPEHMSRSVTQAVLKPKIKTVID